MMLHEVGEMIFLELEGVGRVAAFPLAPVGNHPWVGVHALLCCLPSNLRVVHIERLHQARTDAVRRDASQWFSGAAPLGLGPVGYSSRSRCVLRLPLAAPRWGETCPWPSCSPTVGADASDAAFGGQNGIGFNLEDRTIKHGARGIDLGCACAVIVQG